MRALVKIGGVQYLVSPGDKLMVNCLDYPEGETFRLEEVLVLSDGGKTQVGNPLIAGAKVECAVVRHCRGKKIIAFRHNRRKDYHTTKGHRQHLSEIEIKSISAGK
jgi:large subunit ribosomal protein L21